MAQTPSRLQALDALRGLAALGVVLFHYLPYYHQLYGHEFDPWYILEFGRYGVHLFFMISGFVIFMTLEKTSTPGWFGLARAFRLLPALWVAIPVTFVAVQVMGPADRAVTAGDALWNLTLLHEYLDRPHVDGAYWSLVVEATFYVWMALLFYGLGPGRRLLAVLWLWVAVSYGTVIYWVEIPAAWEFLLKDLLFARYAPLFVSGMLLYRWYSRGAPPVPERVLLALAISHCLLAYRAPFNLFVLGCYGVFALAVSGYLDRLANRPLLALGSLSYALYLIHQNLGYGVMDWGYRQQLPAGVAVGMALTAALALAYGLHRWVEQPILKRFRRMRTGTENRFRAARERPPSVL